MCRATHHQSNKSLFHSKIQNALFISWFNHSFATLDKFGFQECRMLQCPVKTDSTFLSIMLTAKRKFNHLTKAYNCSINKLFLAAHSQVILELPPLLLIFVILHAWKLFIVYALSVSSSKDMIRNAEENIDKVPIASYNPCKHVTTAFV